VLFPLWRLGGWSLGAFLTLFSILPSGCRKNVPKPDRPIPESPSLLDSVSMLFHDVYLWNDKIDMSKNYPDKTRKPEGLRQYIDAVALSAINPEMALPYEFDSKNIGNAKFSTFTPRNTGISGTSDYGFAIVALPAFDEYRVLYVRNGSRASAIGMTRSDKITRINGHDITGITDYQTAFIANALKQNQMHIGLAKKSGKFLSLSLDRENRAPSEVLKDTILDSGNTKIGFLALRSFPALSRIRDELDTIFDRYQKNAIRHLVIDLRYNSGGYVATSRYLANLIIPIRFQGKEMYRLVYNKTMQENQQKHLNGFKVYDFIGQPEYRADGTEMTYADYDYSEQANTYRFDKKGSLDGIKSVYFIVSDRTASASELLINNLKPHLSVKLIGRQTYGKPVGYFAIDVGNYSVYLTSFLAFNAAGSGEYYTGMPPDFACNDDVTADFGSLDDLAVSIALDRLSDGKKAGIFRKGTFKKANRPSELTLIGDNAFVGMLDNRKHER